MGGVGGFVIRTEVVDALIDFAYDSVALTPARPTLKESATEAERDAAYSLLRAQVLADVEAFRHSLDAGPDPLEETVSGPRRTATPPRRCPHARRRHQ